MRLKVRPILNGTLVLLFLSCMQTKTLVTEPDEDLSRIKAPVYCGTYSSYVNYGKDNTVVYNDSVSKRCNLIYDSIVKTSFKKLPRINKIFVSDSVDAKLMATDFADIINLAIKNESIKKFRANDVFYRLTEALNYERFLFIVPTGYTRTSANLQQLKQKDQNLSTALNIIGATISLASLLSSGSANFIYFPGGQSIHAQGSNCYALIYHKSNRQFTFYRQQFFIWEQVHLMETKYLKKQAEYLLKEYL